jgi:ABC-type Fe3+-hydroxamate transport system substrate-binding protein
MPNNESKHDKFVRIAEARTNKIVDMIRLLGNCSNKKAYEFNKEEVSKIFNHLEKELKMAKGRFDEVQEKEKKFRLR